MAWAGGQEKTGYGGQPLDNLDTGLTPSGSSRPSGRREGHKAAGTLHSSASALGPNFGKTAWFRRRKQIRPWNHVDLGLYF